MYKGICLRTKCEDCANTKQKHGQSEPFHALKIKKSRNCGLLSVSILAVLP